MSQYLIFLKRDPEHYHLPKEKEMSNYIHNFYFQVFPEQKENQKTRILINIPTNKEHSFLVKDHIKRQVSSFLSRIPELNKEITSIFEGCGQIGSTSEELIQSIEKNVKTRL